MGTCRFSEHVNRAPASSLACNEHGIFFGMQDHVQLFLAVQPTFTILDSDRESVIPKRDYPSEIIRDDGPHLGFGVLRPSSNKSGKGQTPRVPLTELIN
ncbi:MAG TPA: hypothetical protein VKO18_06505 [Terriglobia bacterium]|nr:hypothetical protein [Terriglobia bacterium]